MSATPSNIQWPSNQFFWAVLEPVGTRVAGPLPPFASDAVEELVPVPLNQLHCVGSTLASGQIAVCAIERATLETLPINTLSLSPMDVPACISTKPIASNLNLLVGDFEPAPLRSQRSRRWRAGLITASACIGLLTLGMVRRAWTYSEAEQAFEQQREAILRESDATNDPARLQTTVDRLRLTRGPSTRLAGMADAGSTLEQLLLGWPTDQSVATELLSVTPTTLTVVVSADSVPDHFAQRLPELPGWQLTEPRLSGNRLTIQYRAIASSKNEGGT